MPNDLLDHLPQHRLGVVDCSRLAPGNEAIGTDEQRTVRADPIRFAPVAINALKFAFRPNEVSHQRHLMGSGNAVGCLTPCSSCTSCHEGQRLVVEIYC